MKVVLDNMNRYFFILHVLAIHFWGAISLP